MIKKLFTSESKTVTGAAIIIGLATLASRIVALVRDRTFAHYFGAGPIMDAYYSSFKIPDLIYNLLIVGALTAGFIPVFTKVLLAHNTKSHAWKLANNVMNIIGVALVILCSLGIIFTPHLTPILFPGFTDQTRELAISFTRIMFLSPILLGISMVLGGILQSLKQFVTYSLAPVLYNLGIIMGALVLVPLIGPTGLAWGVVIGGALHLGIQLVGAWHNGYRWHWVYDLKDPETREIGRLMLPRTIGLAVTQVNNIIVTTLASFLTVGSVAVYNYADNLQAIPTGLIAIPFALAVFPILSSLSETKDRGEFIKKISETARQVLFLVVPVMVIMLLLRAQIVRVILGSGVFDWQATIATANALAFFAIGLIGTALLPLLVRAFFALSDSKTPFIIAVVGELVTITFSLLLMRSMGVSGLTLASSLGDTTCAIFLIIFLRRRLGRIDGHRLITFMYKVVVAAGIMAVAIQILKGPLSQVFNLNYFWGILLQGLISGTVGLLIYGVLCYILKVQEMTLFAESFRKKWLKFWNIKEGIDEAERLN